MKENKSIKSIDKKINAIDCYKDNILFEDLNYLVGSLDILKLFNNHTILITGATGMIGSQLIKTLLFYNEKKNANITIIAHGRNIEKAQNIFGYLFNEINYINGDVQEKLVINQTVDYIIHGASITSSKDFVEKPIETINTAVIGSSNLLELAKEKKVKGFVYISSLEVYGLTNENDIEIKEDNYGYIDILNVRSSYSESKQMVECMCASYSKQFQLPIKIARLCQTFGAGVEYYDSRVFAQFARCVIEKKDIILHTKGETLRNYCYTRDAIKAILLILIHGESGEAYNVANSETAISVADMAKLLVEKYPETKINLRFDIDNDFIYGYNPINKIRLNTEKIQSLGWKAEVGIEEMYDRMIKSMKNNKK